MRWVMYDLQVLNESENAIGQVICAWNKVATIPISISTKLYTNVEDDMIYRMSLPVAITHYKGLNRASTYRIVSQDAQPKIYNVDAFNTDGRLSTLALKEVIM